MSRISIHENGIYIELEITEEQEVRLLHISSLPFLEVLINPKDISWFTLAEIHVSGENQMDHHGLKHTGCNPGVILKYTAHMDYQNGFGRKVEIGMQGNDLSVTCHMQFFTNMQVIRFWTEIENRGKDAKGLEYVSSFSLTGIAKEGLSGWEKKSRLHIPHNTWCGEAQWKQYGLPELGLSPVYDFSMKRLSYSSSGTWPTAEYLPMGFFENLECGNGILWQIENNGSWQWEISDIARHLYVKLSGPTEQENHWWKNLKPGEKFTSVLAAVVFVNGGFDKAIGEMTKYRRAMRRPHEDNEKLPVIFNDFMNCLCADPTTEKLTPLIDAACRAGCEYFCIDAGWYSDGDWWDSVGEWKPSTKRFLGGIKEPLDYIRSKGMIPGLWLELEVLGIHCPLAKDVPDNWFFKRHGKPVIDHGRYQLDFRNPEVIGHANRVIDRLVNDYGIGYIKMDYNIDAGIGTEIGADSFGDGLLQHNRAYIDWVDDVFNRYPELVIENCGSGGLRMEYALLGRHSIQSCTDQSDYKKMAVIAAACPSAVTPEQGAIWSYPRMDGDCEEVIFNMVNAMLMRIHQSGQMAKISPERFSLIKEGIDYYKKIRNHIKNGLPFWPLGMPSFSDPWLCLGLDCGDKVFLSVWRMDSDNPNCILPIPFLKQKSVTVKCGYPSQEECGFSWNRGNVSLSVEFGKRNMARLFEFRIINES